MTLCTTPSHVSNHTDENLIIQYVTRRKDDKCHLFLTVYISSSSLNSNKTNKTVTIYRRPAKLTHFIEDLYIVLSPVMD